MDETPPFIGFLPPHIRRTPSPQKDAGGACATSVDAGGASDPFPQQTGTSNPFPQKDAGGACATSVDAGGASDPFPQQTGTSNPFPLPPPPYIKG